MHRTASPAPRERHAREDGRAAAGVRFCIRTPHVERMLWQPTRMVAAGGVVRAAGALSSRLSLSARPRPAAGARVSAGVRAADALVARACRRLGGYPRARAVRGQTRAGAGACARRVRRVPARGRVRPPLRGGARPVAPVARERRAAARRMPARLRRPWSPPRPRRAVNPMLVRLRLVACRQPPAAAVVPLSSSRRPRAPVARARVASSAVPLVARLLAAVPAGVVGRSPEAPLGVLRGRPAVVPRLHAAAAAAAAGAIVWISVRARARVRRGGPACHAWCEDPREGNMNGLLGRAQSEASVPPNVQALCLAAQFFVPKMGNILNYFEFSSLDAIG